MNDEPVNYEGLTGVETGEGLSETYIGLALLFPSNSISIMVDSFVGQRWQSSHKFLSWVEAS